MADPAEHVDDQWTRHIIGAAIEVHRHLGPGLTEPAYERALTIELSRIGISFTRQLSVP